MGIVEGEERLVLPPAVLDELDANLAGLSERTIAAIGDEIAEYRDASQGDASEIEKAVALALAAFLRTLTSDDHQTPDHGVAPVMEAAHSLGRGEARVGRTMTALLAAYRVGARIAWQEQSAVLVRFDVPATSVAQYAQLVFEYIDELSSSSAAGHQEQLSTSGRVREQLLERLSIGIVTGEPAAELERLAHRADWELPDTLTVVVLRSAHAAAAVSLLDTRTLRLSGSLAPGIDDDDLAVLLVTDAHRSRPALIAALVGRGATVGPSKAWLDATDSFDRVVRALRALPHTERDQPIDTDHHLATLVLHADPVALDDLRARVLQPLMDLTPSTADRLTETLESWLLHQGRRSEVAADLHVHPQTVRYRMNQLRELFGGRIDHPDTVRELIIALTAHREDASSR